MSDTIIVAIITAIATTVPQIVVNIINNKHQLKLKQYELRKTIYQKVVDEFIENVTNCMDDYNGLSTKQSINFYQSINKIQIYFPKLDKKLIDNLVQNIQKDDDTIEETLKPIVKELSKLLSEI